MNYGIYKITMNNGDTYQVNANNFKQAFQALNDARIVNAPESAVKSCTLIQSIKGQ